MGVRAEDAAADAPVIRTAALIRTESAAIARSEDNIVVECIAERLDDFVKAVARIVGIVSWNTLETSVVNPPRITEDPRPRVATAQAANLNVSEHPKIRGDDDVKIQ